MKKENTLLTPVLLLLLWSHARGNPVFRQFEVSEDVQVLTLNGSFVCQVAGEIYQPGDDLPTEDPCEYCTCQPPGFACEIVTCEHKPGCRSLQRSGLCCPDYVCDCEFNGRIYRNGDRIRDNPNACDDCYCVTGEVQCSVIDCRPPHSNCIPVPVEGLCCPSYDCSAETQLEPQATTEAEPMETTVVYSDSADAAETTDSSSYDSTTDGASSLDETTAVGMKELLLTLSPITESPSNSPELFQDFVETPVSQDTEESIFIKRVVTVTPVKEAKTEVTEISILENENSESTTLPSEISRMDDETTSRPVPEITTSIPSEDIQKTDDEFWSAFLSESSRKDQENTLLDSAVDSTKVSISAQDAREKIRVNTKLIKEQETQAEKTGSDTILPQADSVGSMSEMLEIRLPISPSTDEAVTTTSSPLIEEITTIPAEEALTEESMSSFIFKLEATDEDQVADIADVPAIDEPSPGQLRQENIDSSVIDAIQTTNLSPGNTEAFIQTFKSDIDELEEKLIARENEKNKQQANEQLIDPNEFTTAAAYETTTQALMDEPASEDALDSSAVIITEESGAAETTESPEAAIPVKRIKDEKHDYWINMMLGQSNPLDTIKEINKEKEALDVQEPSLSKEESSMENAGERETDTEVRNNIVLSGAFENAVIANLDEKKQGAEQTTIEPIFEELTTAAAENTVATQTETDEVSVTARSEMLDSETSEDVSTAPEGVTDIASSILDEEISETITEPSIEIEEGSLQLADVIPENMAEPAAEIPENIAEPVAEIGEVLPESAVEIDEAILQPAAEMNETTSEPKTEISESLPDPAVGINEAVPESAVQIDETTLQPAAEIIDSALEPAVETVPESAAEISDSALEPAVETIPEAVEDKIIIDNVEESRTEKPSISESEYIRPEDIQEEAEVAVEMTTIENIEISVDAPQELPDSKKRIFDTVMSKNPVLIETPSENENREKRKRIKSQFEHLARKYGLRPLTKRTFREDVKRRRVSRRKNRKVLLKQN